MTMRRTIQTPGSEQIDGMLPCMDDDHVWSVVGETDDPTAAQRCRCGAHAYRDVPPTHYPCGEPISWEAGKTPPNAPTAAEREGEERLNDDPDGILADAWTAAQETLQADGNDGYRITEAERALSVHVVVVANALRRAQSALLAARRENDRAIEAWSRTEGERLKLQQEVRDLRTALNAALAATPEPR